MLTADQNRIKGNWQMRSDIVTLKDLPYFSANHVYQLFDIIDELDKHDTENLQTIPVENLITHIANHIKENPEFRFKNLESVDVIRHLFIKQEYENVALLKQALIEELTTYFENNIVSGEKIIEFNIENSYGSNTFIINLKGFDEDFDDDIAKKNIKEIGNKYGVRLFFNPSMMPK